jgi:hypothetical protein
MEVEASGLRLAPPLSVLADSFAGTHHAIVRCRSACSSMLEN